MEGDFWTRCVKAASPNACWNWTGAISDHGYGIARFNGGTEAAHRVAYQLIGGEILPNKVVMHSCDNRRCINPAHLSLGSIGDNNRDRHMKGRSRGGAPRGEKNGAAKLTRNDVLQIREGLARGEALKQIAARFKCTASAVGLIKRGKRWAWV